ncbi:MAG: TrmH family RNA methyltransferase [Planctomycetota bacterium]
MHLALYQPQVPGNIGAVGRTCIGLGAELHLIGPLAVDLSARAVRRAGVDYWPMLRLSLHPTPEAFLEWLGTRQPWLVAKHGRHRFDRATYAIDDIIILGNEVRGIPAAWHERWPDRGVHIPMRGPVRSFNLSCAAAVVAVHAHAVCGLMDGCDA